METIPIARLTRFEAPPSDKAIRGIVTLVWPYSSLSRQCAFLVAEPDFRLRHYKGQVRVRFSGPSAEAVAKLQIGIGDEVVLSLAGGIWQDDTSHVRTPGKSVDGELLFQGKLKLQTRSDTREDAIEIDKADDSHHPRKLVQDVFTTPRARPTQLWRSEDVAANIIYSSPAFTKRLRLSGDYEPAAAFDPFVDYDAPVRKKPRKSIGDVRVWRYADRTPSPTPSRSPSVELDREQLGLIVKETEHAVAPSLDRMDSPIEVRASEVTAPPALLADFDPGHVSESAQAATTSFPENDLPDAAASIEESNLYALDRQDSSYTVNEASGERSNSMRTSTAPQIMRNSFHDDVYASEPSANQSIKIPVDYEMQNPVPLAETRRLVSPVDLVSPETAENPLVNVVPPNNAVSAGAWVEPNMLTAYADNEVLADTTPNSLSPRSLASELHERVNTDAFPEAVEYASNTGTVTERFNSVHGKMINESEIEVSGRNSVNDSLAQSTEVVQPLQTVISPTASSPVPITPVKRVPSIMIETSSADLVESSHVGDTPESAKDKMMAQTLSSLFGFAGNATHPLSPSEVKHSQMIESGADDLTSFVDFGYGENTAATTNDITTDFDMDLQSERVREDVSAPLAGPEPAWIAIENDSTQQHTGLVDTATAIDEHWPAQEDIVDRRESQTINNQSNEHEQTDGVSANDGSAFHEEYTIFEPEEHDSLVGRTVAEQDEIDTEDHALSSILGSTTTPVALTQDSAKEPQHDTMLNVDASARLSTGLPTTTSPIVAGASIAEGSPGMSKRPNTELAFSKSQDFGSPIVIDPGQITTNQGLGNSEPPTISQRNIPKESSVEGTRENTTRLNDLEIPTTPFSHEQGAQHSFEISNVAPDLPVENESQQIEDGSVPSDELLGKSSEVQQEDDQITEMLISSPGISAQDLTSTAPEESRQQHTPREESLVPDASPKLPSVPQAAQPISISEPPQNEEHSAKAISGLFTPNELPGIVDMTELTIPSIEVEDNTYPVVDSSKLPDDRVVEVYHDGNNGLPSDEQPTLESSQTSEQRSVSGSNLPIASRTRSRLSIVEADMIESSERRSPRKLSDEELIEDQLRAELGVESSDLSAKSTAHARESASMPLSESSQANAGEVDLAQHDTSKRSTTFSHPSPTLDTSLQQSTSQTSMAPPETPAQKSVSTRWSHLPDNVAAWFSPENPVQTPEKDTQTSVQKPKAHRRKQSIQSDRVLRSTSTVSFASLKEAFRTPLAYFNPLTHLERSVNPYGTNAHGTNMFDIIAVSTSDSSGPERAKIGPKDFFTVLHITDASLESGSQMTVEVFRPYKIKLPRTSKGDVLLLRSFAVRSRDRKPYLISTDASAYCVWRFPSRGDEGKDEATKGLLEVKGPPVEIGEEEEQRAKLLREWWLSTQQKR